MTIPEYNKELLLAHKFIKKQYENFLKSNKIKSDEERRAYAHAVQTIGYIAHNCTITKNTKNILVDVNENRKNTNLHNNTKCV